MDDVIRVGFVSSRLPEKGMVQVTYPDRDRMVTDYFPVLSFGNEYHIPEVNEQVLVLHLSNDVSSGVVIGAMWNETDVPDEGNDWYKKIGNAVIRKRGEAIEIVSPEIILSCSSGSITVSELINLKKRVDVLEARE